MTPPMDIFQAIQRLKQPGESEEQFLLRCAGALNESHYGIEEEYRQKLDMIEDHFRYRMQNEQAYGCRMAAAAVVFMIWALTATAIAWWALARVEPARSAPASERVLYPRPSGDQKDTNMLLIVNNREQAAEAMELRAQRQVALVQAAAKRSTSALQAEQVYNATAVPLEAEIAEIDEALAGWYKANRKELEAEGRRSVELPFGTIGMRLSPPKLVTTKKITWAKVVELIKEKYKGKRAKLDELLRTKVEPEKKAIAKLPKEELAELGCKVAADDEFYVEMKPEALERLKAA